MITFDYEGEGGFQKMTDDDGGREGVWLEMT